jgi:AcrR family transcriptional regulator
MTPSENHGARRRWIIDTAIGLMSKGGLEEVTIRRIAAEMGFSTSSVTHYFPDKGDLLLSVYRSFSVQGARGFAERYRSDPSNLPGYLADILSMDDQTLDIWRCSLEFRSMSARDERFKEEQLRYVERCTRHIEAFARAYLAGRADLDRATRHLLFFVTGMGAQMADGAPRYTPAGVREEIAYAIAALN